MKIQEYNFTGKGHFLNKYWVLSALWVALHKGTTMVPAYEREDPLCRWMFMSCTPDHTLSIQRLPGSNGQADWRISSVIDGYIDGVNKTRRVRDPPPKPV